jgi:medium-chain acyl-[acyl-carrier-protein] hydrolase
MTDATTWIARPPAQGTARLRLYCFPYAGGGTQIYRRYAQLLPPGIEVCMVQLPGRERRFSEPASTSVDKLVRALLPVMRAETDLPWAFFGHSLGALIAYELARALRADGLPLPRHLFVSAHGAPHLPDTHPPIHNLPDDEFIEELKELNGTPAEVFEEQELVDLMLPLIRADFTAAETYEYEPQPPLDCPITVFGGSDDPLVSEDELTPWQEHTVLDCTCHSFEGDHFFIHTAEEAVMDAMRTQLCDVLAGLS